MLLKERRWKSTSQSSEQEKEKLNRGISVKISKEQDGLLKQEIKVKYWQEIPVGTLEKALPNVN